jgi:hypothetical protein
MSEIIKFKQASDLQISLENDADIGDYENRFTYDFAVNKAERLAQESFGKIPSNHSPAYRRLLRQYEKEVADYDDWRD